MNGKIIAVNSLSVNKIGLLTSDKFKADIEFQDGFGVSSMVRITPRLNYIQSPYYDIQYKITSKSDFNDLHDLYGHRTAQNEYFNIDNNDTMCLTSMSGIDFTIEFKLINKVDKSISLVKTYDISLKLGPLHYDDGGITGGTINGEIDPNLSFDFNMSVSDAIQSTKDFLNNSKEFFGLIVLFISMLPSWITVPLSLFLTMLVAITVIHLIRG